MMKRFYSFVLIMLAATWMCQASMSTGRVRKETRFLTDKMAYELRLTTAQYNDVYEINFDFIYSIRHLLDDVLDGDGWALDRYYDYLDMRNDDLRWVLSSRQYSRFMGMDRFFRPIYVDGRHWLFRIHLHYRDHDHFYYPKPKHYSSYCGGHHRKHFHERSFYAHRYDHSVYKGDCRMRGNKHFDSHRRNDFGDVKFKYDHKPDGRPHRYEQNNRPSNNNRPSSSSRPSVNSNRPSNRSESSSVRNNSNDKGRSSVRSSNGSRSERTTVRNNSSRSERSSVSNTRSSNRSERAKASKRQDKDDD